MAISEKKTLHLFFTKTFKNCVRKKIRPEIAVVEMPLIGEIFLRDAKKNKKCIELYNEHVGKYIKTQSKALYYFCMI